MRDLRNTTHTDRLAASAEAKKARLAKFKPKPMVTADMVPADREAERQAELERVRADRQAEREAKKASAEAAEKAREEAALAAVSEREQQRKAKQREELLAMYGRRRGNR